MSIFDRSLHRQEHAPSYYAASQRDKADFPQLRGDVVADVCIVGGGFTGVSTAVELSEKGYKVVLLEGQRVGWGASGRNGGQIIGGFGESLISKLKSGKAKITSDGKKSISTGKKSITEKHGAETVDALNKMGVECVDIIKDRVKKYGIDCDLRWGYFDAAMNDNEMHNLLAWKEELEENGYSKKLTYVDAEGVGDIVGSDRYIGGLVNEGYGHVQVLDLCKGEARAAESLGAKIFERSLVTSIEKGDEVKVHTGTGTVRAKYLVLCGNAYLKQLVPNLAPKISPYIFPASSYVIATEPLSDEQAHDVMRKNYAVCDQRTALDYFRLSADNRLLFGGMANYSARDPKSITGAMLPSMLKVFPQLRGVAIDFAWGGHMGIGLNRIPQLGRLDDNIFYAQAYSGHGVAPSHMSGRILSELISTQAERFDLFAKVKHWALPGGDLVGQPMLALGMLFYKIRDELRK